MIGYANFCTRLYLSVSPFISLLLGAETQARRWPLFLPADWFFFRGGYSGWKATHLFFLGCWIIASPSEQKALDTCSILLIGLKGYRENGWTDEMSPWFRESCLHVKKPEVIIQPEFWGPSGRFYFTLFQIFYSFLRGTLTTSVSKLLTE